MAKKQVEQKQPMLKVTLVRSTNSCRQNQIKTVEALGLRKIRQSRILPDLPSTRGMIRVVNHLVAVEEVK